MKKHYDLYQAAIDRGNTEERDKTRMAGIVNSEQGCELEVLLRKQVGTIEKRVKDRSGRLLPEWIRPHRDWQMIKGHLRKSEFYEPLDGCKERYEKIRHDR
jgi:hypothetical protein